MVQEIIRIGEAGVAGFVIAVVVGRTVFGSRWVRLAVVEDDDLVDAEDGEGAGDLGC